MSSNAFSVVFSCLSGTRAQMISVKNGYKAGDTVQLTVFRGGEYLTLSMTFDEQVNQQAVQQQPQDPKPQQTGNSGYGVWPR